jgi:hypothetical protein
MRLRPVLTALAASALGCGTGDAPPRATAAVAFVYLASTTTDPAIASAHPDCVAAVGGTHLHPGWQGFDIVFMTNAGDRWTVAFSDVPVGTRQRIRVSDPNACSESPTGAATREVFANGVLLTTVVGTPGNGVEPGLAFTVGGDGGVTP